MALFVGAAEVDHLESMLFKFRQSSSRRFKRLSLAGDGLAERIRSTVFAMLGITAAAGLGLVLLFSQVGTRILSPAPLPVPPAAGRTLDRGLGSSGPVGAGGVAASAPAAGLVSVALSESSLEAAGDIESGSLAAVLVRSALGGGRVAGNGGAVGGTGSSHGNSAPAGGDPGEGPREGTESEPAPTPVSGSSSSSGLFVRKSVVKDPGELGEVSEGAPVPTPEPEPPAEPEIPVEPAPEPAPEPEIPPLPEGPVELESPVEFPPEAEATTGSESTAVAEESPAAG